jgi:hypothetical protein
MICAHASQALPRFPPVVFTRFSISLTGMVRNKAYAQGWRLRINMGNVFFEQKKYSSAIKMYRMALDNVPSTSRGVRLFPTSQQLGRKFLRLSGKGSQAHGALTHDRQGTTSRRTYCHTTTFCRASIRFLCVAE